MVMEQGKLDTLCNSLLTLAIGTIMPQDPVLFHKKKASITGVVPFITSPFKTFYGLSVLTLRSKLPAQIFRRQTMPPK